MFLTEAQWEDLEKRIRGEDGNIVDIDDDDCLIWQYTNHGFEEHTSTKPAARVIRIDSEYRANTEDEYQANHYIYTPLKAHPGTFQISVTLEEETHEAKVVLLGPEIEDPDIGSIPFNEEDLLEKIQKLVGLALRQATLAQFV